MSLEENQKNTMFDDYIMNKIKKILSFPLTIMTKIKIWFMKKERILLFIFCMISLWGFFVGLEEAQTHYEVIGIDRSGNSEVWWRRGFNLHEFFQIWMVCSIPLIIQNVCFICFRGKK
jgi:hypothetical protein